MVLEGGDVCFYKIATSCGLAKIDILNGSSNVIVEYLEFEDG